MNLRPHLAFLAVLALGAVGTAAPGSGHSLLFVIQRHAAAPVVAADAKVQAHLEQMGFAVTTVDQRDPATAANGKDVVVISSSISAHVLEGKYRACPEPVVTWEAYILPHLGLTGKKEDTDYGTLDGKHRYLWMVNAPHPLSAGLPAGLLNVMTRGGPMNWGHPGPGAIVVATIPGELDKSPYFAYEKGATMDGENLAPARRVMVFLDNTTFPSLNDAGVKLFDAAVLWAAGVDHDGNRRD